MTFAISKELQFLAGHKFYVKLTPMATGAPMHKGAPVAHPTRLGNLFVVSPLTNFEC
jgi:hypothetical protein